MITYILIINKISFKKYYLPRQFDFEELIELRARAIQDSSSSSLNFVGGLLQIK